jgi:pyruvate formate lyase activating enzyme
MARSKEIKGIIFDIMKYAIHDGPGIRTTVFLKGCPLACWWCQNPESQKPQPEKIRSSERRKYSALFYGKDKGMIGHEVTVEQVMIEVEKDKIFYEYSGGGVTLSGGEPLMQPDFLLGLLKASKKQGIHTALDTSGYGPWTIFKRILKYVDLFLYDLKLIDARLHEKYTGEDNRIVLENLENLAQSKARVVIRLPVITKVTDTADNIRAVGKFAEGLKGIEELHLLPYNYLCRDKYQRIRRAYAFKNIEPPSDAALQRMKRWLEAYGLRVKIRGRL